MVPVRVLTFLLKPAVFLLLGASAVFSCNASQAITTFNWYLNTGGAVADNSGTFAINETISPLEYGAYEIKSFSGKFLGQDIIDIFPTGISGYPNNNKFLFNPS